MKRSSGACSPSSRPLEDRALEYGHQLDHRDAEISEIGDLIHQACKSPCPRRIHTRVGVARETPYMEFVNDGIGLMMRRSCFSPIKLGATPGQDSERCSPGIRSFPHRQCAVKIGREEDSPRVWIQQNLLRIKAMDAGQIFSRHRVRIIAALPDICARNAAMPDMAGLVPQEVKTVNESRNHQFRRSVEQQRHAFSVLRTDGEIEGPLLVDPSGAEWQRAALDLLPTCGFRGCAMDDREPAIDRGAWLLCCVLHTASLTAAPGTPERSNFIGGSMLSASERFDNSVSSRNHRKAGDNSMSSGHRQRQFAPALPGMFMRLSAPRLSRSCSGATVKAAIDSQARFTSDGAASSLVPGARFR